MTPAQPPSYVLKDWPQWPILNQWSLEQVTFTQLEQGLTNANWLITPNNTPNQQFVLRINAENSKQLHIDRQTEIEITQAIQPLNVCPNICFQHESNLYWLRPFIQGRTLAQHNETLNPATLKEIAHILKKTHNIPINPNWPELDLLNRLDFFWQQIVKANPEHSAPLSQLQFEVNNKIQPQQLENKTLCHFDCNLHNWIKDRTGKLYLIDWEYAALGNPAYDLAVLCDSAKLTSKQIQILLDSYGEINKTELNQAQLEMKYLEILWFAVQKQTHPDVLTRQLNELSKS